MAPKVVNKPIAKAQATAEAVTSGTLAVDEWAQATALASALAVDEWDRPILMATLQQRRAQAIAVATACLIASGLPRRIVAKIMCRYI